MSRYNGKKRAADWMGRRIVSTEAIRNGWATVPAGTLGRVHDRSPPFGGLDIDFDPCTCCGVKVAVRQVGYHKVRDVTGGEA